MGSPLTWGHNNRFFPLLRVHNHGINPGVLEIRKIHDTAVRYRGSPSILFYARPRVPPRSENVFALVGIDDYASASFTWTSFDVVDGGCDGVDEDRIDPDRLPVRGRKETLMRPIMSGSLECEGLTF